MKTKIDNQQTGEKIKILLPAIGLGLFATIVGLKLVLATINKTMEYQSQKVVWEAEAEEYRSKVEYFSAIDQQRLNEMERVLNDAVFKQDKSYYLVAVIRQIAAEYGFEVDSFQAQVGEIGKVQTTKKVDSVNLGIKVVMFGPKEKYLELITRLERTLPVLSINNFEIKTNQQMVGIDMSVNAFFIPKLGEARIDDLTLKDLLLSEKEISLIGQLEKYQKFGQDQGEGAVKVFTPYSKTNPFIP